MKYKEVWFDEYRGINFEVNKFEGSKALNHAQSWTFYLHIAVEQFPEEVRTKLMPYVYFTAFGTRIEVPRDNPLENLEWHGGMTWISVESEKVFTSLKAGCDYQHLWDEGQYYSSEEVILDAKKCIDSLYAMFPALKTGEQIWEEFRKKFPGKDAGDNRYFRKDGTAIPLDQIP